MHLGWQVTIGDIIYSVGARRYGKDGYRVVLRPVLKRTGPRLYGAVPKDTPEIEAGTIFNHMGIRDGWYMCGRLGLHGVDRSKGEFYGIAGFKTGRAAAFQLLKERGYMDWEARC